MGLLSIYLYKYTPNIIIFYHSIRSYPTYSTPEGKTTQESSNYKQVGRYIRGGVRKNVLHPNPTLLHLHGIVRSPQRTMAAINFSNLIVYNVKNFGCIILSYMVAYSCKAMNGGQHNVYCIQWITCGCVITVIQQGSIYDGKGTGAVAGGNQDFSENKNEKG